MKLRIFLVILLHLGWLTVTLPGRAQNDNPNGGRPQSLPTVTLHIDQATLRTEVALTGPERETGLMYRPHLGDNDAMIFLMPSVGPTTFWMKNTLIPLSVAYIDKNGVILEIHDMKALDETPIPSTSDQISFALEVNLHWFALNGIKPGDRIEPPPSTLGKPSL
jgi:uncharacterized membrane protein (UPF0127 family)